MVDSDLFVFGRRKECHCAATEMFTHTYRIEHCLHGNPLAVLLGARSLVCFLRQNSTSTVLDTKRRQSFHFFLCPFVAFDFGTGLRRTITQRCTSLWRTPHFRFFFHNEIELESRIISCNGQCEQEIKCKRTHVLDFIHQNNSNSAVRVAVRDNVDVK